MDQHDEVITIKEAGRRLKLGRTKMYELVATGDLPVVRIGKDIRIVPASLRVWIESHVVTNEADIWEDSDASDQRTVVGRVTSRPGLG